MASRRRHGPTKAATSGEDCRPNRVPPIEYRPLRRRAGQIGKQLQRVRSSGPTREQDVVFKRGLGVTVH